MNRVHRLLVTSVIGVAAVSAFAANGVAQGGTTPPATNPAAGAPVVPVPSDLRPLLVPHRSEMRLVTTRYSQDRALIAGNFAGGAGGRGFGGGGPGGPPGGRGNVPGDSAGGRGRGNGGIDSTGGGRGQAGRGGIPDSNATGRGNVVPDSAGGRGQRGGGGRGQGGGRQGGGRGAAGADSTPPLTISVNRIARLKRFDLSWQAALTRIDAGRLTPPAKAELDSIKTVVATNLTKLDGEATTLGEVSPLMPFSKELIPLIEARLRLQDVVADDAARIFADAATQVAEIQGKLETGLTDSTGIVAPLRANREEALRAAGGVEAYRSNLTGWFTFYNGYDPLVSWWVPQPYRHLDSLLVKYATFLREKVAVANKTSTLPASTLRVDAAPAPKFNEVPDLNEIIGLPQDEMTDIVQRFVSRGAGQGRGTGGPAGAGTNQRDPKFYADWLEALKTLPFDSLTRNAQVDYLYLKKVSELQVARAGVALPPNPPRKTDKSGIPGAARGRDGLIRDLQDELIPYSPEQLIALAEKEFEWCDKEMLKASKEMGFGTDWKAALEKTKTMHVPPGGQPAMIRDLIFEAVDYLRSHDLVTVPEIDVESQRMSMITPENQLTNPFFLGGAQIQVSYPTNTMTYDQRLQSMRGNNRPWSHATAFHEMIPGHNLVNYYSSRTGGGLYRANLGATGPFYGEGWAVYWETIMYDMGFHDTPEERVGALFWRMHRCARIIFSLKFHMGQWSPQEAVDFLVDRVGHERDNAMAEVRRSFQGGYGPLYQAAYLLGALQLRGLRHELVDTKQMTNKQFHDEILRQGSMPITLLKLGLSKQKLTRDMSIDWKFYGDLPEK